MTRQKQVETLKHMPDVENAVFSRRGDQDVVREWGRNLHTWIVSRE
ncbi:MAG: hypothetical protein WB384_14715 [Candidatus Sulfotelmatobacter sp.]